MGKHKFLCVHSLAQTYKLCSSAVGLAPAKLEITHGIGSSISGATVTQHSTTNDNKQSRMRDKVSVSVCFQGFTVHATFTVEERPPFVIQCT